MEVSLPWSWEQNFYTTEDLAELFLKNKDWHNGRLGWASMKKALLLFFSFENSRYGRRLSWPSAETIFFKKKVAEAEGAVDLRFIFKVHFCRMLVWPLKKICYSQKNLTWFLSKLSSLSATHEDLRKSYLLRRFLPSHKFKPLLSKNLLEAST
jgi:hypothetical protein